MIRSHLRRPADRTRREPAALTRRGAALVEFAIIFPVMMILVLGIWELGRYIHVRQILENATREAGRLAATGQLNDTVVTVAMVKATAADYVGRAIPERPNVKTQVDATVTNLSSHSWVNPGDAEQLDMFAVTVTLPVDAIDWVAINRFLPAGATMTSRTLWCSLKDIPLEVDVNLP
ncbi:MAG: TadE/TadG family type IV pilus assembly protein [Planctomycetia bacterium]